jgi:Zn-dependent membrane protease YugP
MFPLYGFFDSSALLLIPVILLGLLAQWWVRSTFNKYARIPAGAGWSGEQVAAKLLGRENLDSIGIEEVGGTLSDHYDPRARVLRLSNSVGRGSSIAAYGVAAHEVGHATQQRDGYLFYSIRHALIPVANLGSQLLIPLLFAGFLFRWGFLINIGIILYAAAVLFQVVTLPVEINASRRALEMLRGTGSVTAEEVKGARAVLTAAAFTYIAATLTAVVYLVYLLLGRRR